jgi:fumarylacetoacetate (FAA) hydrolase
MRLASLHADGRDGRLIVASQDGSRYLPAPVATLQAALERWDAVVDGLERTSAAVDGGDGEPLAVEELEAPLPRAYQYCEGSTYLSHMERNRAARGAPLPPGHGVDPAVLLAASDRFLAATEPIELGDEAWALDLEATVGVIVDDVPMGIAEDVAGERIRALVLINDLTLRDVLPGEFAKGVGFFQAKPLRAFAPFAVTPDELDGAWDGSLLHATVKTWVNGEPLGSLDTGVDAAFDFRQVIAYAARTRPLAAGSIVGTGTISNRDPRAGFGCLAEKRAVQIIDGREPTRYLRVGDTVRIEAFGADGNSIFGAMDALIVNSNGGTTP